MGPTARTDGRHRWHRWHRRKWGQRTQHLVTQTDEAAGDNCENGGVRIDVGLDADNDGELSESEIQTTEYVCAGINGADGVDGDGGRQDGIDGTNGENGDNGLNTVIQTDEAAGDNCQNGGVRIDVGLGADKYQLSETEIQTTEYVCAGINGTNGTNGENGDNGSTPSSPKPTKPPATTAKTAGCASMRSRRRQ